ncbi:hypothetical protein AK812_SmicGene7392 [Symbiodinium microadriaticum]|uniref:Uncharacterized protein n=1 Tax=Symbiodinium microadriaticum TaxID=2951 RepID=A0A1Q9ENM1_SYMMI|nr:hypothetical protein AK812_SmicGene7392 [Symbiodinium microadriaticum]
MPRPTRSGRPDRPGGHTDLTGRPDCEADGAEKEEKGSNKKRGVERLGALIWMMRLSSPLDTVKYLCVGHFLEGVFYPESCSPRVGSDVRLMAQPLQVEVLTDAAKAGQTETPARVSSASRNGNAFDKRKRYLRHTRIDVGMAGTVCPGAVVDDQREAAVYETQAVLSVEVIERTIRSKGSPCLETQGT